MSQNKQKKTKLGDCFERSYHLLIDGSWKHQAVVMYFGAPLLVHGIVWHDETGWHTHAWIEDGLFAYDFIDGVLRPVIKSRYYEIGKIKTGDGEIFKYTEEQAEEAALRKGHYSFSDLPCDK